MLLFCWHCARSSAAHSWRLLAYRSSCQRSLQLPTPPLLFSHIRSSSAVSSFPRPRSYRLLTVRSLFRASLRPPAVFLTSPRAGRCAGFCTLCGTPGRSQLTSVASSRVPRGACARDTKLARRMPSVSRMHITCTGNDGCARVTLSKPLRQRYLSLRPAIFRWWLDALRVLEAALSLLDLRGAKSNNHRRADDTDRHTDRQTRL